MNEIVARLRTQITDFKPEKSRALITALDAAVKHARDMEDWEAGQRAAEWMVAEIKEFVSWWGAAVGVREGSGSKSNAERRSTLSKEKAEEQTGISQQQVSRWKKELNRPGYEKRGISASHKKFLNTQRLSEGRAALQTGEMEWYTPEKYIEKARNVLGGIDLDPASCENAQKTIQAKQFFTAENNGLEQVWRGRVWLNPPYAGALVSAFADKMLDSVSSGDVTAAIMLTNSYTETSWFHKLAEIAAAICFTRGRIKFESPHGEKCSPTNGQVFFYFGDNPISFQREFLDVGLIMVQA